MMPLQVGCDLRSYVDCLKSPRSGTVDITRLGQDLKDRRPETFPGGFAPNRHLGITAPTVVEEGFPKLGLQDLAEDSVLLPHDQIEEIPYNLPIVVGRPRTNKSRRFEHRLDENSFRIKGNSKPLRAYMQSYWHRGKRLIYDDAELLWADANGRQLIRQAGEEKRTWEVFPSPLAVNACDNQKAGRRSWGTRI